MGERAGGSAEYLRQSLLHLNHTVIHIDASQSLPPIRERFDAIIISDFPSAKIDAAGADAISRQIRDGTRFLMIGGWDSFSARGKSYAGHPLESLLPVTLSGEDDRRNVPQGLIVSIDSSLKSHPDAAELLREPPPVICGYNNAPPKPGAQVLVWMNPIASDGNTVRFLERIPLVVKHGSSVACLTDLAPHWCGGLVDWGGRRLSLAPVEVGRAYPVFVQFLLTA